MIPFRRAGSHPFAFAVRSALIALTLAGPGALPAVLAQTATQPTSTALDFELPAGPLSTTLTRIAVQAGLQLTTSADLTSGRTAPAIQGRMTASQALDRALAGSELVAEVNGHVVTIKSRPAAAGPGTTLPEVRVTARAERADGLPRVYAGGQVARGGRMGLLGNMDFMETPFSTTAYTEQRITDTQAKDIGSVIGVTDASVYVSQPLGIQESFLIRGFPVHNGDVTFNGLAGMAPNMRGSTEMVERIEVLRGPSAMLKGMPVGGGVGGSVNLVPKRAGDKPLTRLTGTYASDSQFGLHADTGRRFGENKQFGLRFNGVYRDGDTAVDDQQHRMALGSLGLDWRGERVRLSADLYRQRERLDAIDYFGIFSIAPAVTRLPAPFKGGTNLAAPYLFDINTSTAAMARAEVDISDQIMAYVAYGRQKNSYDALIAQNSLLNDAGDLSNSLIRQYMKGQTSSAEAGIQGQLRTGPVDHAWALAVTSYEHKSGFRNIRNSTDPDFLRRRNLYAFDFGAMPDVSGFSTADIPFTSKSQLSSVGVANRMSFLDERVQLTLGLRHQEVKTTSINATTGATTVGYDKSALSPSAALLVKVTPSASVYGSAIQGLSQGSTAPATAANPGEVLPPFKSKQLEVGAKYDFGGFAATAALFQITRPSAYTDPVTNVFAANGEQRNRGLELGVFGEASRGLRLMGGMTYLDATLRNQLVATNNGNQVTGVPRLIARMGAEYDLPGMPGLTLTGLVNHVGKRYATADNRLSLSSYTTLSAGLRYATLVAGKAVVLRASIDNLTNEAYWGGSWGSSGDSGLSGGLGAPRTFLLSVSVDF